MAAQNQALAERIESRIDHGVMGELAIASGGRAPAFASMRDVLEFAKVMAVSGIAIRAHLRNNVGACAAVLMQAQRWEMDPFTVGNKSYAVNDQLAFESQLITAVINTRAPIKGRLKTRFEGVGGNRICIASATFQGEDEPTEVQSPPVSQISPKNSPLWKTDPDQQLAYYTKRLWARRECPEVLLGVYDPDELEGPPPGPDHARDVTPPRPTRADFAKPAIVDTKQDAAPEPEPWEITDDEGEVRSYSSHLDWVQAFCEYLSTPHATWANKEGFWETNSPAIGRLRQIGAEGEKLAQEIHDTFGRAREAEDERRAAERAAAEAKPAGAATFDPVTEFERIWTAAQQETSAAGLDSFWRLEEPLAQRMPNDLYLDLRGKIEGLRRQLAAKKGGAR